MHAIILAGGRGERLLPLTQSQPKPMVPLMGRPLIDHTLAALHEHGFRDVIITLGYLGHVIRDHVGSGARYGVRVHYTEEQVPLGTAGAMRQAFLEMPVTEPFLVIAADSVTDINLAEVYAYFQNQRAQLGMVVTDVHDPRPYGVVKVDDQGYVADFVEKPAAASSGRTVNTGIYYIAPHVVQHIPGQRAQDFGHQLFPEWLKAGRRIHAYATDAYWCDVGTIDQYQTAHFDVLEGRVQLPLLSRRSEGSWVSRSAFIHPTARLVGPVMIGERVTVEAGAVVGPYAVVGRNSRIGSWTRVAHSVLFEDVSLAAGIRVKGAILGRHVAVGGQASVADQVVVGNGSHIGWGSRLHAGLKLPLSSKVPPGSELYPYRAEWHGEATPPDIPAVSS